MSGLLVTGIDPSLTGTGLAQVDTSKPADWACRTIVTKSTATTAETHARLNRILDDVARYALGSDLVVIEEPLLRGRAASGKLVDRNGLYWLILDRLYRNGVRVAVAKSNSRERYATGKGSAAKDVVLAAAVRRWTDAPISNNNEADAVVLAAMGADWLGEPPVPMPASHRVGLDKVEWPA